MTQIQHFDRLPEEARKRVRTFCEGLERVLGKDLRSLIVYGSAAGPEYVPGRSDVNLLVVAERLDLRAMRGLFELAGKRPGRPVLVPLFLTPADVRNSTDVFAIEFREMKDRHLLLRGEDLLQDLEIREEDVRRGVERELRTNLLRMRRAFLEPGRSSRDLEALLHRAFSSLLPILRHLLHLQEGEGPRDAASVLSRIHASFGVQPSAMGAVLRDRQGDEKIGGRDAEEVFGSFLSELEALTEKADRFLCDS